MKIEIVCRLPGGCFLPLSSYDRESLSSQPCAGHRVGSRTRTGLDLRADPVQSRVDPVQRACTGSPRRCTGSAREPGPVWICEQTLWPAQGRLDKESQSFRHLVWKFIDKGMHFLISDILLFWHFLWHSTSAILSIIFSNIFSSILFQTSIWYFLKLYAILSAIHDFYQT